METPANPSLDVLFNKVGAHLEQKLPFVIYKKPDSTKVAGLFQHTADLYTIQDFKEIGYVFAPFQGQQAVLIPEDRSELLVADWVKPNLEQKSEVIENASDKDKIKHIRLVENAKAAIGSGLFNKVVLSRQETIEVVDFNVIESYKNLAHIYPTAFAYCWYHPQKGLWMGAFSEQLLKINSQALVTMALAGTQKWQDDSLITWEQKEIDEQQFVTDFIVDNLKELTDSIQVSTPYTLKAGTLAHIRTDIKAVFKQDADVRQLIAILHPTPAVCGLPKAAAKEFILEYEGYDREYYSGYHGELNKDFVTAAKQTDLFVNLRCMKMEFTASGKTKAHLYIGGGITKDSIPVNEWQETVNKSRTMKKVLSD